MATQKIKPTSTTAIATWNDTTKKHEIWDGSVSASIVGSLVNVDYDEVQGSYPDGVTEVYAFYNSSVLVATVTVIYTDITKEYLLSAIRT